MSSSGRLGDASAILYLIPFAASAAYGLYLWAQAGISAVLPSSVYLTVTRDPYLFVIGSVAVMLGVVLDLRGTEVAQRKMRLGSLGNLLQSVAMASLILTLIAAFYANGFLNVTGAAEDFIVGRYGMVFPGVLVLLSFLVTARFNLSSISSPKVLGIIALLLVPASVYEIGKRETGIGLGIGFVLLVVGLLPFIFPKKGAGSSEQAATPK